MIIIKTIPHKNQRLKDVGDYWDEGKTAHIRVSKTGNLKYDSLLILHELIEYILIKDRKIPIKAIDQFDIHCPDQEPGMNKKAPYHKEHIFATKLEKMLAKELRVNWNKYDKAIINL